jgi:hypothetical protein
LKDLHDHLQQRRICPPFHLDEGLMLPNFGRAPPPA